jgi:hypothetical protein
MQKRQLDEAVHLYWMQPAFSSLFEDNHSIELTKPFSFHQTK